MRQEAARCRAEADSYAIPGTYERELGNRNSALFEQTEAIFKVILIMFADENIEEGGGAIIGENILLVYFMFQSM